jgi:hypothetical protein
MLEFLREGASRGWRIAAEREARAANSHRGLPANPSLTPLEVRQVKDHPRSSQRRVLDPDRAPVQVDYGAADRQAEAAAAGVAVARGLTAVEAVEDQLALGWRDAWAVVVDPDREPSPAPARR